MYCKKYVVLAENLSVYSIFVSFNSTEITMFPNFGVYLNITVNLTT